MLVPLHSHSQSICRWFAEKFPLPPIGTRREPIDLLMGAFLLVIILQGNGRLWDFPVKKKHVKAQKRHDRNWFAGQVIEQSQKWKISPRKLDFRLIKKILLNIKNRWRVFTSFFTTKTSMPNRGCVLRHCFIKLIRPASRAKQITRITQNRLLRHSRLNLSRCQHMMMQWRPSLPHCWKVLTILC